MDQEQGTDLDNPESATPPEGDTPPEKRAADKEIDKTPPAIDMESLRKDIVSDVVSTLKEELKSLSQKPKESEKDDTSDDDFVNKFFTNPKGILKEMLDAAKSEVLEETQARSRRDTTEREFWNQYKQAFPKHGSKELMALAQEELAANYDSLSKSNKSIEEIIQFIGDSTTKRINKIMKDLGAEVKENQKDTGIESATSGFKVTGLTGFQSLQPKKPPKDKSLGAVLKARRKQRLFKQRGASQ